MGLIGLVLTTSSTLLAKGQRFAKAQRIRFVTDIAVKSVRRRAPHGRGELDEPAPGCSSELFRMLHQQLGNTVPSRLRVDHQCGNAHDRLVVLQHFAQVRREKADDPPFRDGEDYWIGPGFAELPNVFRCLLR